MCSSAELEAGKTNLAFPLKKKAVKKIPLKCAVFT
jgi:hypothetical protein